MKKLSFSKKIVKKNDKMMEKLPVLYEKVKNDKFRITCQMIPVSRHVFV